MLMIRAGESTDLIHAVALESPPDTARWLGRTGIGWHERAFADPEQEHLVVVDGQTVAGFAVLAGLGCEHSVREIRRIVVATERRGTGVGRLLLRAALDHLYQRHRAIGVWLDVKEGNTRARTLYESEGFKVMPQEAVQAGAFPVTTLDNGEPDPKLIVMLHGDFGKS